MIRSKRLKRTRRSVYSHTEWQKTARTRLSKSSIAKYHITDPRKAPTKKLRQAYIHTQYNKLRHAGVGRLEAEMLAQLARPEQISQVAKDRRLYIDEMVLRHKAPTSKKAWIAERKKMRKKAGLKYYSDSQWKDFSEWYGKHPKKPFPFPARRKEAYKKKISKPPTEKQIYQKAVDAILKDIAEHNRLTMKPSTQEPRTRKARTFEKQGIRRQTVIIGGRKQTVHRDAKGRFTKGK
jgi:hypothetical protein